MAVPVDCFRVEVTETGPLHRSDSSIAEITFAAQPRSGQVASQVNLNSGRAHRRACHLRHVLAKQFMRGPAVPPPHKVDPLAYVVAVTRAAALVQTGTDLKAMSEALERAREVQAHPGLIAALEKRIRRAAAIKLMLARARIEAAGPRAQPDDNTGGGHG